MYCNSSRAAHTTASVSPSTWTTHLDKDVPDPGLVESGAFFYQGVEMFTEGGSLHQLHDDVKLVLWSEDTGGVKWTN